MKNGSTFTKSFADFAQHRSSGGITDDKNKFCRENGGSMDYQVRNKKNSIKFEKPHKYVLFHIAGNEIKKWHTNQLQYNEK